MVTCEYTNTEVPVIIQVNVSGKALGAALIRIMV